MAPGSTPGTAPRRLPSVELAKLAAVKPSDCAIRFVFGAGISIVAGVIGNALGGRAAGLFLAFPAILPASLTLIQDKEGTRKANRNAFGAILGGIGLVAFAIVGTLGFGRLPAPVVLLAGIAAWLLTSIAGYAVLCTIRPAVCEEGDRAPGARAGDRAPRVQEGDRPR